MYPSVKLTYFDGPGYAEAIRLTLTIGGIEFEDERLTHDQFKDAKEAGKVPFLSLPTLTVDGEVYAESNALLRYAAKLGGLYPTSDKAAMKVDMASDGMDSLIALIFKENSKEARAKVIEESFPRYIGAIEKMYAATKGPYLLDDTMSFVDVKLHMMVTMFSSGLVENIPGNVFDTFPHLLAMSKTVLAHEKVQAWNAAH